MNNKKVLITIALLCFLSYTFAPNNSVQPVYAKELKTKKENGNKIVLKQKLSASVSDYINTKKQAFDQRKRTDGDKEVTATISFKNWTTIDEIVQIAGYQGIEVQSVNYMHRGKGLGHGELYIRQNQEIQSAWDSMTDVLLGDMNKKLKEKDSKLSKQSITKISKKKRNLEKSLPMIHSIRVNATINNLDKLSEKSNIRLIDIPDVRDVEEANTHEIPEKNIKILGIIPDDVTTFTGVPNEVK